MNIISTLRFILSHPLNKDRKISALKEFFIWQIFSRISKHSLVFKYGENSKLLLEKGMHGATGNLYCGLHEFEDMAFLLHFLQSTDMFIDIGANIGSYTILASKEVGADTISIEPIPATYDRLVTNIKINKTENIVKYLNIGLGSNKSILNFTQSFDTINHVALDTDIGTIKVNVERFDDIIELEKPTLIKIDVEGFETEVLKGMEKTLANLNLHALIIELNGSGKRYGFDEDLIHKKLIHKNFTPYKYSPFARKLEKLDHFGKINTIYIRDINFVQDRILSSENINIFGKSF